MPEQQAYQANKYRIRQLLVGERLESHVGRRACKDREYWRQLGLATQVTDRIRQFLVEEGLERHARSRASQDQEQQRPMGLYTQVHQRSCRCR